MNAVLARSRAVLGTDGEDRTANGTVMQTGEVELAGKKRLVTALAEPDFTYASTRQDPAAGNTLRDALCGFAASLHSTTTTDTPIPGHPRGIPEATAKARGIQLDSLVNGELSTPDERDVYPLNIKVADSVMIEIAASIPPNIARYDNLYVSIRDAQTRENVTNLELSMGVSPDRTAHGIFMRMHLAPGQYQVLIGYSQPGPPRTTYSLRIHRYRSRPGSEPSTIRPGTPFEGRLDYAGDMDVLSIPLLRGQEVRVRAELLDPISQPGSPSTPIYIEVAGVFGTQVEHANQFNRSLWRRVERNGTHQVRVSQWSGIINGIDNPYVGRYRLLFEVRD